MEITSKQELKYVMDFYHIPFIPIEQDGKDLGKITAKMEYERGRYNYFNSGYEYLAFEIAFEKVKQIIELQEKIGKEFSAIAIHENKSYTWMYADYEGEPKRHHVYPTTVTTNEEKLLTGTMQKVFEEMYVWNDSYRYCNGDRVFFKDKKVEEMYMLWIKMNPQRTFDLYYRSGIVD